MNTKRGDFPGLAAVIIGASVLIAFAAMQMPPSRPAVAQDASSGADLAELSVLIGGLLEPCFDPKVTTYAIRMIKEHCDTGIDSA